MKLLKTLSRTIVPFIIVFLFSCAVITVNIYFPARDVEKAYENLENQLMKPPPTSPKPPSSQKKKVPAKPSPSTSSSPQSWLNPASWFESVAYAEDNLAAQIAQRIMRMPDVVNAYRRMGKRLPIINHLRDRRWVGEAKTGFLVPFVRLKRKDALALNDENHDRSIVILGMAKAILEINHLPINKKNLDKVYPKAASEFADLRRKRAKPGWKVQLPNGKWIVKR